MKLVTKEEEDAHNSTTMRAGVLGGALGGVAGLGGVAFSHQRFPGFRSMTLPFKVFLVSSAATFGMIVNADRESRKFEKRRDASNFYVDESTRKAQEQRRSEDTLTKWKRWGREHRYGIITASWVLSMSIALGLVSRNRYLTRPQKLVQARVYAQALTLGVFVATAAFEIGDANQGAGRWETVKVIDPNDPEHKREIEKKIHHERYQGEDLWKDMIESEERKIRERDQAIHEEEHRHKKEHPHPSHPKQRGEQQQQQQQHHDEKKTIKKHEEPSTSPSK